VGDNESANASRRFEAVELEPLRVGIIAPPWVPVPPPSYGGTELVLDVLARGIKQRGHDVVLFTTGDSTCEVYRDWLFERADPDRIGAAVIELRHAGAAYDALANCDIVHDHTLAGLFLADLHLGLPVVTTNHGPFDDDLADIYRRADLPVIAISNDQASRAPSDIDVARVIHHGLDLSRYPFDPCGGRYLASLGRMNPTKGIDTAIEVARRAGMPMLIAAKMRERPEQDYFEQVIRPMLGGDIEYIGEVGHAGKIELLQGALALVNPVRWPEPFGLVMIEAMACGTPAIVTRQGAAPELVTDGVTGFVADSVEQLASTVGRAGAVERRRCREIAELRFSMDRMARDHIELYRSVIETHRYRDERSRLAEGRRSSAPHPRSPARVVRSRALGPSDYVLTSVRPDGNSRPLAP
jgi:glycosyltransferase involved in cell wall biosynthesis